MKIIEKILILLFLIATLVGKSMAHFHIKPLWLGQGATIFSLSALITICIFYILSTKISRYTAVNTLLMLYPIFGFFKILNMPFAAFVILITELSSLLMVVLLLMSAMNLKRNYLDYYLISALLLVKFVFAALKLFKHNIDLPGLILAILLVTSIVALKFRKSTLMVEAKSTLTIFALLEAYGLISLSLKMMR